jgi:type I restriction enzyme S subunit
MELIKSKYKSTEFGLIPEDWETTAIGDLLEFKNGLNKESEFFGYGTPIVNYMDVFRNNGIRKTDIEGKVFLSNQEKKNFSAKKGDVFFTRTSETQEEIGMSAVLLEDVSDCVFSGFLLRGRPKNNKITPEYFQYCLTPSYIRGQIISTSSYTTRALTNGRYLSKVKISFPPTLTEQKAIATALSDVDALITSLDKLIKKKKAIKQGAMQELLTPKFGWKTKTLKEVSTFRRGSFPQPYGLPKWYDDVSGIPFVQVVDVSDNRKLKPETKQKISSEGAKMSVFVKKGSVILTIQGSIGRICITQYDAYVDRTLLIFESFLKEFNKFFFMTIVHQKFEIEKEKAPGGIIKTITKEALSRFEISFPEIEEQNRIAQILSDMDLEIEALEKKKEKYHQIKQGMMQELLTGKTRLV